MKNLGYIFLFMFSFGCSNSQQSVSTDAGTVVHPDTTDSGYIRQVNPSGNDAKPWLISCEGIGPVKFTINLTDLERIAGKGNIRQDSLFLEGNFEGLITSLWKNTAREIIVHWHQRKQPFKRIKTLEIRNPQSVYRFSNGIKPGIMLSDIVKLNGGKPIKLYGFGWDYGGTFVSFNNGSLANQIPCFGGVFALSESQDWAEFKKIMGDHQISSDEPALAKHDAKLALIRISNERN